METIILRNIDDDIPSSPIPTSHEENSFCISNTSLFQNNQDFFDLQKNNSNSTDNLAAGSLPFEHDIAVLLERNSPQLSNNINLNKIDCSHISLKKRLKRGLVTFRPFESFRALEETVKELNSYFQSGLKKSKNQGKFYQSTEIPAQDNNVQ